MPLKKNGAVLQKATAPYLYLLWCNIAMLFEKSRFLQALLNALFPTAYIAV